MGNKLVLERRKSFLRRTRSPIPTPHPHPSGHSITYKGAVALAHQPHQMTGSGDVMAANASLYTVLVTDQPIERLRLKRPLGNMEFWHQRNDSDLLGLQATTTDEVLEARAPPRTPRMVVDDSEGGNNGASNGNNRDLERGLTFSSPSVGVASASGQGQVQGETQGAPQQQKSRQRTKRKQRNSSVLYDPGATERGIGLTAGWSSTWNGLRQWWRHRGRYQEWRRDVRWAMFNKRVRTATEMFTELFGDDFDSIIPIYPTKSVEKLIQEWDSTAAALERAQYRLKEISEQRDKEAKARANKNNTAKKGGGLVLWVVGTGTGGSGSSGSDGGNKSERVSTTTTTSTNNNNNNNAEDTVAKKYEKKTTALKEKIAMLATKTADLQDRISHERDDVLSDLPSTCFFATFKSQEAAAIAAQANLNPITQRLFDVQPAPSPDDVNWPALERSWWQRQARPAYVIPLILFIMLLPIGAFTGAFAQLTIAFCGNPDNPGPASGSWFCSDNGWARFIRNLLTSIAPSLLLSLYHLVVLPVLVYYTAQAEGRCFSLSQLDRRCADLFFYWDVFNVFLGAMLGGSVLSELPQYLDNPKAIWTRCLPLFRPRPISLSTTFPTEPSSWPGFVSFIHTKPLYPASLSSSTSFLGPKRLEIRRLKLQ